jgi:enoyl-CoA hydratase/carnithine racemase
MPDPDLITMPYRNLKLEIGEEVATLSLNRPPANLLNIELIEELNDALLELRGRRRLEVLVVRGASGNFCDGFDLGDLVPARMQRILQLYMRIFESLRMMDLVQVAAVQGNALGAGFELALGCNLFLAAEDAVFCLPETGMGLFPPIATAILPRIAPRRKAMEWILTGNRVLATELHHHGVVNRLLSNTAFDAELDAFVRDITSKSGPILAIAKQAQFEAYYSTFTEAMARAQSLYMRDLVELQDSAEGLAAQREKRAPQWKNQ